MRRRELFPVIGALGASAFVRKASADTAFTSFSFPATGAPASRTMPNRLADIINVKDYGALGDGSHDDYPAIQAAFDAAFGPASSPNGLANSKNNRPVFFPNGAYQLNSGTPTLTRVVGGHVLGAGSGATILNGRSTAAVIAINGAANLLLERFNLIGGGVGSSSINLDWDNTSGGDGLHDNVFADLLMANTADGIIIAKSGFGGANNLFEQCTFSNISGTGIDTRATSATNNITVLGGGGGCAQLYWSNLGSIHSIQPSMGGNTFDVRVDSGLPVTVIGGRTESAGFLKLTSGVVTVRGMFDASGSGQLANILGGKVSVDGCQSSVGINGTVATATLTISGSTLTVSGVTGTVAAGQLLYGVGVPGSDGSGKPSSLSPYIVSGSGTTWTLNYAPGNISGVSGTCGSALYLRCNFFPSGSPLSGYSGSVVQNI